MEGIVRCLREGCTAKDGGAAVVVIEDSLDVVGGPAVLQQVLRDLAAAAAASRAQAATGAVLALEVPPMLLQDCVQCSALRVLSFDSAPAQKTWAAREQGSSVAAASEPLGATELQQRLLGDPVAPNSDRWQQWGAAPAASTADSHRHAVVIDSLSCLGDVIGMEGALALLERTRAHPAVSCILTLLHADLVAPHHLAAARYLANCNVRLRRCTLLEAELAAAEARRVPHGRLDVRHKQRSGRVRVEAELFIVQPCGGVAAFAPPPAAVNAQLLAAHSLTGALPILAAGAEKATESANAAAQVAQQFAGGMRLGLSSEEQEARTKVVLPYEHRGLGRADDAVDVHKRLMPSAISNAESVEPGGMGIINYVRDTDSEYDSDEDPDDDLDI